MRLLTTLVVLSGAISAHASVKTYTDSILSRVGDFAAQVEAISLKKNKGESYPECVGKGQDFFDSKKCGANIVMTFNVKPEQNSPIADVTGSGPLGWYTFLETLGEDSTNCTNWKRDNCDFVKSEGLCTWNKEERMCVNSAFSGPFFPGYPLLVKYTCDDSVMGKNYKCWAEAARTGECPAECEMFDPSTLTSTKSKKDVDAMDAYYFLAMYWAGSSGDPALGCLSKDFSMQGFADILTSIGEANVKNKKNDPVTYPEDFLAFFGGARCETRELAAALFVLDPNGMVHNDKSPYGMTNRMCSEYGSTLSGSGSSKQCKAGGSTFTVNWSTEWALPYRLPRPE